MRALRPITLGLLAALGCTADTLDLDPTDAGVPPVMPDLGSPLDTGPRDLGSPRDLGEPGHDAGDAGTPGDLGQPDLGVFGDYWVLRPKMAFISTRGFMNAGATAFIQVEIYPDHTCELAGPIEVIRNEVGLYEVRAWAWVHQIAEPGEGDCQFITDQVIRDVSVELSAGTHAFVEPISGQSLSIEILPPVACGQAVDGCNADCDCPEENCVPCAGDLACTGVCGQACNPVDVGCCGTVRPDRHLECPPEAQCETAFTGTGYASGRCVAWDQDPCQSDDDCPSGMFCPQSGVPRGCMWGVELRASTRHPCTGTADCAEGMLCTENRATGRRVCEVPCFSARSRCPLAHHCTSEAWVCEWVGD